MTKKQVAACVKEAVELAMKKVTAATAGTKTAATATGKVVKKAGRVAAAATGKFTVKKAGRVAVPAAATGKVTVNKAGKVVVVKNAGKVKPAAAALSKSRKKPVSFCTKCVAVREEGHTHLPSEWLGFERGLSPVQYKELVGHLARCCMTPNCEHPIRRLKGRDMSAKTAKIWFNFLRSGVLTPAKAKVVRDALGWCCFNKPDDCECDESDDSSSDSGSDSGSDSNSSESD
jgi:hypothetical protein